MLTASSLPLAKAPWFYDPKRKPITRLIEEIRSDDQVLVSKENYFRLIVRLATINAARKRCRRKFNSERKLEGRSRYLRKEKSISSMGGGLGAMAKYLRLERHMVV